MGDRIISMYMDQDTVLQKNGYFRIIGSFEMQVKWMEKENQDLENSGIRLKEKKIAPSAWKVRSEPAGRRVRPRPSPESAGG